MHGMNLLEELQEHVVCGDGAMGTLLLDQGLPMEACLEELSVSDPERVRSIHREYMAAGARVIETNSFGANAVRLGRLGSGVSIVEAFSKIRAKGVQITGVNCMNGPHATVQLLQRIPIEGLLAAYPNAGYPRYTEGRFIYHAAPDYFARAAREMVAEGARLVGGCCGTNPRTVAAIAKSIRDLTPAKSKPVRVIAPLPTPTKKVVSAEEESLLDKIAAGKRVIICEFDPPKTLVLEKFFRGAQELVQAGCDAITLADNSLAILRVSNLAVGAMLKERFDITPLLHLSCRDRNVLGLQSELLGMAALGMRHVLPLTGDPARVGDHPGASSVYDVNSIELISIIRKLNEGFTHAGKSLKAQTRFVIGCTFNPNAKNLDSQVNRLERKVAAGAQYEIGRASCRERVGDAVLAVCSIRT